MNLKEMEDAAQKRQEEEAAANVRKATAEREAEAKTRKELEIQATTFLVKTTGTAALELEKVISVPSWDMWNLMVVISVPEHTEIQTRLRQDESGRLGWGDERRRWQISNPCGGSKYCRDLGGALVIAARLWAEAEEAKKKAAEQTEEQEAQRTQRKLDHIELGLHYVGIFEDHPFLKPIFDLLVAYVEDKEMFEADLDAAEEFTASMDGRYARKLEEARIAARDAENTRHRLQDDLRAEQNARRDLERSQRKW